MSAAYGPSGELERERERERERSASRERDLDDRILLLGASRPRSSASSEDESCRSRGGEALAESLIVMDARLARQSVSIPTSSRKGWLVRPRGSLL